MHNKITIRALGPDDRKDWVPLWTDYLTFYNSCVAQDVYDATFARLTDPTIDTMMGWMAWDGAQAVGLVHVIVHPHCWRMEPVTYLQDLFTSPQARGKGVARTLIETVYSNADAAGRPTVYWMTQQGNATARLLYDRIAQPTDFMKYNRT